MDNQKQKTRSLTSDWTNKSISVVRTDKQTNARSNIAIHDTLAESLYDGEQSTFISVNDGAVGDAEIDLLINFGDYKTVNRIDLSFLKRFKNYWPTKLNIYFGETETDILAATTPDYTINTAGIDEKVGLWGKDIRPIIAKYMRVEIAEFPQIEGYKTETGEYLINFIISEIKLTGTSVKDGRANSWGETLNPATGNNAAAQTLLAAPVANDNFANELSKNSADGNTAAKRQRKRTA